MYGTGWLLRQLRSQNAWASIAQVSRVVQLFAAAMNAWFAVLPREGFVKGEMGIEGSLGKC